MLIVLGSLAACGPSVPSTFPRNSPASTDADEAPLVAVGVALREDPPLPGHAAGWSGLGDAPAGGGTSGHHHMPGMDMSGMDMGGADGGSAGHSMPGMNMGGMDGGSDAH